MQHFSTRQTLVILELQRYMFYQKKIGIAIIALISFALSHFLKIPDSQTTLAESFLGDI